MSETLHAIAEDCEDADEIPLPAITDPDVLDSIVTYMEAAAAAVVAHSAELSAERTAERTADLTAEESEGYAAERTAERAAEHAAVAAAVAATATTAVAATFVAAEGAKCIDNIDHIFRLMAAAHYLNIDALMKALCRHVANLSVGKTPQEIRVMFKITNDFTPEEEDRIMRETAWAFAQ